MLSCPQRPVSYLSSFSGRQKQRREEADSIGKEKTVAERSRQMERWGKEQTEAGRSRQYRKGADTGGKKQTVLERSRQRREEAER
jgi:hypothetical protein